MSTARRPTIVDVAKLAEVSVATVSRAMAGNYPVAAATRARIEEAVASLGYIANANARALSGAAKGPVALVVSNLSDPFFASLARGVELEASEQGRLCLLASTHGSAEREWEVLALMSQQGAGVVVLAGAVAARDQDQDRICQAAAMLRRIGGTLVLLGRPGLHGTLDVTFDAEQGSRLATEHLLGLGHRRLVHLAGPTAYATSHERVAGFRAALTDHGIDPASCPVVHGEFAERQGRRATADLLDAGVRFTGLVCANDSLAQGAIEELTHRGIRVPEQVSVTGFDDLPQAAWLRPGLTTVHVPIVEMARRAVSLGLAHEGPVEPELVTEVVATSLTVRGSTGPCDPATA